MYIYIYTYICSLPNPCAKTYTHTYSFSYIEPYHSLWPALCAYFCFTTVALSNAKTLETICIGAMHSYTISNH